ncbi:MAG: aminotransferase class IV [Micromonosporaceae bacterium]
MERVVAVLGQGLVPADTPILRADDLGVLRGDGVFETLHVRPDGPWLLDAHLDRMARSAQRLDLALPPRSALEGLAAEAFGAWPSEVEGALRLVCTRGPENDGPVTCYATLNPIGPAVAVGRRDGIRLATASLGVAADARAAAPWLLGGVKSLSYGVNMASQRWAVSQGLDDVLWVSADGYALEGPTSTLLWLRGDELCTVPAHTGILPGTTSRFLLDHAGELGWRTAERMVRPDELESADSAWLVSSVRGVAQIRELDGAKLPDSPHNIPLQQLAGFPVQGR